jgi:hypothetical protein
LPDQNPKARRNETDAASGTIKICGLPLGSAESAGCPHPVVASGKISARYRHEGASVEAQREDSYQ